MSPDLIALTVSASMALVTFLSGALIAATPWLTRGREAFAVSVPEAAQADPRIRRMRTVFLASVLAVSAVAAVATFLLSAANPVATSAIVCVPVAAGFALMLVFRARVRRIKRAEGWEAHAERRTAVAGVAEANAPRPLPLAWDLLYLPVMLATLALTLALYPAMPDPVPVHFDAAGVPDDYLAKGWQVIAMPLAVQAFMALCLTASHWQMLRSRRPASPEHPVASAFAYGTFARAQSAALLFTGLVVCASIAIMPLAFAGVVTSEQSVVALVVIVVAAIVPTVAVSLVYGQAGSRLLRRMTASDELGFDDDEHWKLGVFYVNREDPSVVLPRRFGVGWAMNWGNPKAWGLTVLLVAAVVAFVVVIEVVLA
ncbi:DUF1648 domain-containing protein [Olsenella profusa]|uniref:DUF1648 domain-containing protein n=1 Tax=Olsenella profusa TaxID=138595 RepID=A0ABS2EZP9_9ACTN|nr:DUF1648 domain-containing protein [Olsenella profusa]MBM6774206.1 DUF1648 domain-containing protein [Olsenella profusa]